VSASGLSRGGIGSNFSIRKKAMPLASAERPVEGTIRSDGTFEALDVEVEDDSEVERSIMAPLEAVSTADSTLTQLGVAIQVTENTEFDDDEGLEALETGTQVETDYYLDNGRFATEVEREDD
jgi:hypothetical protein